MALKAVQAVLLLLAPLYHASGQTPGNNLTVVFENPADCDVDLLFLASDQVVTMATVSARDNMTVETWPSHRFAAKKAGSRAVFRKKFLVDNHSSKFVIEEGGHCQPEGACTAPDAQSATHREEMPPPAVVQSGKPAVGFPGGSDLRFISQPIADRFAGKVEFAHPAKIHFFWVTKAGLPREGFELNFFKYTSLKAACKALRRAGVEPEILLHSDSPPGGIWWDRLILVDRCNAKWILVEDDDTKGLQTNPDFPSHRADVVKLLTVSEMGGVSLDFDVFLFNGTALLEAQRVSECLLGNDLHYHLHNPSDKFRTNAGFFSCIAHSGFLRQWALEYWRDYVPTDWLYNVDTIPSRIARKYPYPLLFDFEVGNHWDGFTDVERLQEDDVQFMKLTDDFRDKIGFHLYCQDRHDKPSGWYRKMWRSETLFGSFLRFIHGDGDGEGQGADRGGPSLSEERSSPPDWFPGEEPEE
uniref:Nucleotide-diphospho-sugar transferase domain-containing protein n=1 Tax=Chromera velia CCMP2878 TaxID=1169474 RepID=A0A0G4I678_9ALVE|mmetsp:Transcript_3090/g.6306  ORF Transcript_3090/g.6306 Transcript_3090/m.6306 type:complete len:470 (-) Transcript_3090:148-1557(-)|eukprot:Cvel_1888.t1-p1 / transcript=Cvel_1888.t1 / gene=Cvel_1888 / organism=Chromera_velia_CCMP2878 / gene_product=hypothetical protein / transcript_product=hypothetical protein / location=Cvel_scaffold70:113018-115289(+) / protein_length=469 / sequence_SO=supercontig / SO=protein_coding / is_pseudo=false